MFDTREFESWPSGDCKPVLKIIFTPKEISEKYNLIFMEEKDDLDWFKGAHFYDDELGPIVMMKHEHSPIKGTDIYIDASIDTAVAVEKIITLLQLKQEDVIWKREI